eukprot:6113972-Alexandrium_andersonii.AAC.1
MPVSTFVLARLRSFPRHLQGSGAERHGPNWPLGKLPEMMVKAATPAEFERFCAADPRGTRCGPGLYAVRFPGHFKLGRSQNLLQRMRQYVQQHVPFG